MGRSRRHLSEFSMVEAEVAFVDNISSIVDIVENLVRESVASVLKTNYDDIETYLNFRTTRKVKQNRSFIGIQMPFKYPFGNQITFDYLNTRLVLMI